jgi:2-dehydro-3-deoxyphosphogluconate aldolase/(4S)-4-hydroxy-2-oxoglutarate aldolase
LEREGLLPVVRGKTPEVAIALSHALVQGGIQCLEVTLTVPDAPRVIAELCAELGQSALIGAGTVLTLAQAESCLAAGARFLVSPGFVPGLIEAGHARGAAVMPGALTPTEVITTWQAGADLVKVFPCSALGGAGYLKALSAPFPDVKLLPTGGVTLDTLDDYVRAGASALGVGAALADTALLEREGADAVARLAAAYVERYRAARVGIAR